MEASADIVIKKHDFLKSSKGENILNYYTFDKDKIVGSGGYGSVVVGVNNNTKEKRAIKIIKKSSVSHSNDFANEIEIMRGMVILVFRVFSSLKSNRITPMSSSFTIISRMQGMSILSWSTSFPFNL